MTQHIELLATWFRSGGPFMWALLLFLASATAVTIERLIFLYVICPRDNSGLVGKLKTALSENKPDEALKILGKKSSPVCALLRVAVESFKAGGSPADIQENIEEAAIGHLHRFSERLNYLSLFANVATLVGLLGTISGLMQSFSALATVDAAQKATLLAAGISEAMITTAFGLIIAVPCMIVYTIFANRRSALVKDLDESTVRLLNFMKKKRTGE
ncbi:MAG: MotA/TolQ/ExbB proton channel family protein [Chitinispirillales bacterium]|jgi:biopolymer transport protein ExbB/TolQ|nr:MotA/TolQ/ExbB proton channel family protein [Chitinispirillales bacterium]